MNELLIQNTISIQASADKVWAVLCQAEYTKIYMFGCATISDWKVGSDLLWQGHYEGQDIVFVKGKIVEIDPPHRLVYTVFDPHSKMEDIPSNYLTVTYQLESKGSETILNVTQGDYNTVAEGERRYQESYNNGEGWNPILQQIKSLAEQ